MDLHSARGLTPEIILTVQCALPWFVLAFTASSLAALGRSSLTRWLLSNRRYLGLVFAFGMVWHFAFVGYSIVLFGNQLNRIVTTFDLIGLVFLLALTVTSFQPVARHMSTKTWRRLHKTGVYVIWLLATYIYARLVRPSGGLLNWAALSILLAAWGLRVAAWLRPLIMRRMATSDAASGRSASTGVR